ncbi:hypothetical protein [Azospirillum halopraeferens]|uniref:hypothetical protein n=1 Tax=Azospirillum halopraeferens TaxID=34010 RepID=UPI0003FB0B24|nr:hypothetical protein [Azospirillum halopraeferens]
MLPLLALLVPLALAAPAAHAADPADPLWPCVQRFVPTVSASVFWDGPPVEDVDWRSDAEVARLVDALLADPDARPDEAVTRFADSIADPAEREERLTQLFAGLLERINAHRSTAIAAIRKQAGTLNTLADQLSDALGERGRLLATVKDPDPARLAEMDQQIYWMQRVFDSRRRAQTYLCEEPVQDEQRLGVLARAVLAHMP